MLPGTRNAGPGRSIGTLDAHWVSYIFAPGDMEVAAKMGVRCACVAIVGPTPGRKVNGESGTSSTGAEGFTANPERFVSTKRIPHAPEAQPLTPYSTAGAAEGA